MTLGLGTCTYTHYIQKTLGLMHCQQSPLLPLHQLLVVFGTSIWMPHFLQYYSYQQTQRKSHP
ncbi:ORF1207 [White spot syndrome virus]|uniref:Wsv072 n=3 Tax=White spot syndrome virus TaxID=342409 RepID=Q8VBA4_WSSVS|nr:wsv072 [Shrimp white spot syndrome virus]AFX59449.1 wsv072 [White spot syndrome virus]AAL33076.1 wsv072 [Shrimp white spot syndrome virus]AAL88997.1 WSSV129 [Shrimp white spot syndrome virus]ATU84177.1 ORF1207 [White spot syndrome virus]AWQ60261.1 wsv072 [Shrimp white spot syndrome virus]